MLLMIDNYDCFTYNLVHLFQELGAEVRVFRNDAITPDEAEQLAPSHVVISPGPGRPADAGVSVEVIHRLGPHVPTLGVCLGHQAIVAAFGGEIGQAHALLHGKSSPIAHDGKGVFAGLPAELRSRPLSLPRRNERAGGARGDRTDTGRRGDGRSPSRAPDRGRPVPPRERPDAARERARGELPRAMIQAALAELLEGRNLSREQAREVMDEIMRGEATQAQIGGFLIALRLKGETRRRDRRLCGGDARPRPSRPAGARRPRRHGGHGRRRRQHDQHLDGSGDRRRGGRRGRREARQPRRLVRLRLGGRARGARIPARAGAGANRAIDRRARLRLHVRAGAPPCDAPCGTGAARAGRAYRIQRARPAHEPRRRPCAGDRRLLALTRADAGRGARTARRAAGVRRPRRTRHRRALADRPERRVRGRRRRGAGAGDRSDRSRDSALRPGGAARRIAGRERHGDPRRLRRRRRRPPPRHPAERGRRDRGLRARGRPARRARAGPSGDRLRRCGGTGR